jgi:hypothetical protein
MKIVVPYQKEGFPVSFFNPLCVLYLSEKELPSWSGILELDSQSVFIMHVATRKLHRILAFQKRSLFVLYPVL